MFYRKLAVFALAAVMTMTAAACGSAADEADSAAAESAEEASDEEAGAAGEDGSEADDGSAAEIPAAEGIVDEAATYDNIDDYVELGDHKGLEIVRQEDVVTDNYPAAIGELVGYRLTFPEVDYGRTVTMDYVGTIDGVAFDGGTAENADLKIGSHSFIDDFEDQLVGAKPGDVAEVRVTFPEDYRATELAGKEALFTCTIHSVWADLWDGFVDMCEVKQYPRDIYELMYKTVQDNNKSNAEAYNMTVEEYREAARIPDDSEQALTETKWALVNKAVIKELGVTPDTEAYQAMQEVILSASGFDSLDAAVASGLSETQIAITTDYYTALQALLREHGLI